MARWQKDDQEFAIPWIGSAINTNGRVIGYRSLGGKEEFDTQSGIFNDMLAKLKTQEKRWGAQAGLDGYEVDEKDTEAASAIENYRKTTDMLGLMASEETNDITLDQSNGGQLLMSVDQHSGIAQSPAAKASAQLNSFSSRVAAPPTKTGAQTQVSPPTTTTKISNSQVTTETKTKDKNGNNTVVNVTAPTQPVTLVNYDSSNISIGPRAR